MWPIGKNLPNLRALADGKDIVRLSASRAQSDTFKRILQPKRVGLPIGGSPVSRGPIKNEPVQGTLWHVTTCTRLEKYTPRSKY